MTDDKTINTFFAPPSAATIAELSQTSPEASLPQRLLWGRSDFANHVLASALELLVEEKLRLSRDRRP